MKKKKIFVLFMVLSVLGLLASLYLVKNHYDTPVEGGFCDLSAGVSCSLVNSSIYSELLGIPVAILGALWFVILFSLSWKAMKKDRLLKTILAWNIMGFLFVTYFVIAEILLKSICLFCTLVHVLIVITLILSFILYRKNKKR